VAIWSFGLLAATALVLVAFHPAPAINGGAAVLGAAAACIAAILPTPRWHRRGVPGASDIDPGLA
jgi:hypothetical protein